MNEFRRDKDKTEPWSKQMQKFAEVKKCTGNPLPPSTLLIWTGTGCISISLSAVWLAQVEPDSGEDIKRMHVLKA